MRPLTQKFKEEQKSNPTIIVKSTHYTYFNTDDQYINILKNVLQFCINKSLDTIKISMNKPEMDRTVDNDECQDWLSNEVHYEGELLKFWKTTCIL